MITKENIDKKLKFIGLDLNNLPKSVTEFSNLEYTPSKLIDEYDAKVYRYVPISKIEILLTPHNKSEDFNIKYKDAISLNTFFKSKEKLEIYTNNEDMKVDIDKLNKFKTEDEEITENRRYLTFLNMLLSINENRVNELEVSMKKYLTKEPFLVTYDKSRSWSIYYSPKVDKYFMLVCTDENDFTNFFYLLKQKIKQEKNKKEEYIYCPISGVQYSKLFLEQEEILNLENNLWYFTKNWPTTYELYNKKGEYNLVITGQIDVFENLTTSYKIIFENKNEAVEYFKLVKALFMLEKETTRHLKFNAQIKQNGSLGFFVNGSGNKNVQITINELPQYLYLEYNKLYEQTILYSLENEVKSQKQQRLLNERKEKEEKLNNLQNEITLFSEAKKTFFGKFRYFLKKDIIDNDKKDNTINKEELDTPEYEEKLKVNLRSSIEEKYLKYKLTEVYCTIDEYINLYKEYDRVVKSLKNNISDINTLKLAIKNIDKKIDNSKMYLKEIMNNKKNIFNFFKFTNYNQILSLPEGEVEEFIVYDNKIESTFNLELDFEIFGQKQDTMQREHLTKEELNAIYLSTTNMLRYINMSKSNNIDRDDLINYIKDLNKDYEKEHGDLSIEYDIFGGSNVTQVQYIKNKSFRETSKNIYNIIKYNKNITVDEMITKLDDIKINLENALKKIPTNTNLSVYKFGNWSLSVKENTFDIYNLDINHELENGNLEEDVTYNLIKLNLNENIPIAAFTNSVFYNNQNNTLPKGMDKSTKLLLDMQNFDILPRPENKIKFTILNDDYAKIITLNIKEYNLKIKTFEEK